MATVYSSTGTCGGRTARQWRIALTYSTSTSNTAVTVSWTATIQMKSAAQYGVYLECGGETTTGYITSSSSSWKDVCSVSGSTSYARTTSAQTKALTASGKGQTVSGYSAADGSLSVSASISVPALASYAVTYDGNTTDTVSNLPSGQTKYYGKSLTLTDATPTREGYNFLGWSTSSTATAADSTYAPGSTYTGNAALKLFAVWELAYHIPIISAVTVGRCDAGGSADDYGTYALVTFSWQTDAGYGATIASASVALEGGSSVAATIMGTNAGTGSAKIGGSLSSETSYKVTISVTDSEGGTGTATGIIPAVMFPIDFLGNGKGVAFGMPASREGYADFGYKLAIDGIDVDIIQQATFYSTAANADETATAWVTTALDEVKAATDGFDEVATFKSGVVTFLKDGCYELSGSIYWSGSATSGGVGIFNGDVEESSAFFTGDMSQITAVLMPTIVNVTAGETRIFKRRCVAGAYMRYGCYSWLTIKYLGTGGSLIGGSGESAGASGAYLPLTGGVMTGSITNADGNSYKFASDAGMMGNSSGALILNSVNDQGVYLRPNGSSGSDGVVVKAAGLLPEASGAMALGADDRRFQQVFGREYYFDNADAAYSSAYKFGMYQWDDNFTFVTRNAANTHLLDAWQIAGSTGVTNFLVRPTLNGAGLATQSEIPTVAGVYLPLAGGTMSGPLVLTGGDAASGVGNMQLDTNGQIVAKGTTSTLFGRMSDTSLYLGHSSHSLTIRGSGARPTYNGSNMALQSDVPSLSGYATQSWVTTQISNASISGGSVDLSDYARLSVANTYNGEQKFQNSSYCPTVTDTASGVGCAFKASRGMANEMLVDKLIMTASTGKLPFYSYSGTSGGAMSNLAEVASIDSDGSFTAAGGAKISGRYVGSGDDEGLIIGRASNSYAGLCLGDPAGVRSVHYLMPDNSAVWRWNNGSANYNITHPGKSGTVALTSDLGSYLPLSGGALTGPLDVGGSFYSSGKMYQGSTSSDTSIASMNRFESDLYVQGNGVAPNQPTVAGFYLGKSASDENRHMDIVSGGDYSYIDFNKAGNNNDYDARLLVNVANGLTEWHWGGSATSRVFNVAGTIQQNGANLATQSDLSAYQKAPVTLYDNASGTTGTVTLSESAANFSYIEIICQYADAVISNSTKVPSPDGKTVDISSLIAATASAALVRARLLVSGTTITFKSNLRYDTPSGNTYENIIYITRVVGYK